MNYILLIVVLIILYLPFFYYIFEFPVKYINYLIYITLICFLIYTFVINPSENNISIAMCVIIMSIIYMILNKIAKQIFAPIRLEHSFFTNIEIENNIIYLLETNKPSTNSFTIFIEYSFDTSMYKRRKYVPIINNPNNTYAWMFPKEYFTHPANIYIINYMHVKLYKDGQIIHEYNTEQCKYLYYSIHHDTKNIKSIQEIIRICIDSIITIINNYNY